jgi:hypothetical protein
MSTTIPDAPRIFPRPLTELDRITFWWRTPLNPGGAPISSYTLFCTSPSITQSVPAGNNFACVRGLISSIPYTFSMYATNSFGDSPSSIFRTVFCGSPPAPPTNVRAFLLSSLNTGSVTWTPPSDTFGSPVLGYNVSANVFNSNNVLISTIRYTAPANFTSLPFPDIASNTRYEVYANALNDINENIFPNFSTINTGLNSNLNVSSVFQAVSTINAFSPNLDTPVAMNFLTINGAAIGFWDYVKKGTTTIASFNSAEWFTPIEDIRSAWVVVNGDLTIDSGQIFTPPVRKLFTVLYVTGNLTVNGSISMTARGANHNLNNVVNQIFNTNGRYNYNGSVGSNNIRIANGNFSGVQNPVIPAGGGTATSISTIRVSSFMQYASQGITGLNGGTGGGGCGAYSVTADGSIISGGNGSAGSCFSGGSGGSAARISGNANGNGGQPNGGAGGINANINMGNTNSSSGVGNPSLSNTNRVIPSGTGGTLIVICDGNISGTGTIEANGVSFTQAAQQISPSGSSGGGSVNIFCGGTCSITPTANGGDAFLGAMWDNLGNVIAPLQSCGGSGGNGTARVIKYYPSDLIRAQFPFFNYSGTDVLSLCDSLAYTYAMASPSTRNGSTSNLISPAFGTSHVLDSGTLTLNGQSLGNWEYSVRANFVMSSVTPTDYFSPISDNCSSWIFIIGNLNINNGVTFTPPNRKLFTVLYISGNLNHNGIISMSARGANHSGNIASGAPATTANTIPIATGTYSGVTNPEVPATGGAGGAGASITNSPAAAAGAAGTGGGTGGGGGGAPQTSVLAGGNGSAGTSFTGGCGGGGAGSNAEANGGFGGDTGTLNGTGGAGNNGGTNTLRYILSGAGGTGGVLILIVKGTISGTGTIISNGVTNTVTNGVNPGGSSGGGSITVLTTNSDITPTAAGGSAVTGSSGTISGAGGAGTARILRFPYGVSYFNFVGPTSSVYDLCESLYANYNSFGLLTAPISLGTLSIQGSALGLWEYFQEPSVILNTSNVTDFFSVLQDTTSSWIVINGDFTVPFGVTFTPPVRKLFMVIYVSGNLIVNGTISMTARGANHSALIGATIRIANGTFDGVVNPQVPGSGGAAGTGTTTTAGNGSSAIGGGTGGGGSGGTFSGSTFAGGAGWQGTSFSGGGGGGGATASGAGGTATFRGGAGGTTTAGGWGGVGNPGGTGSTNVQNAGTGGVLIIICKGNVSGLGFIQANGVDALRTGTTTTVGAGGSSGGGSVTLLYGGTNTLSMMAAGGTPAQNNAGFQGGGGGFGTARALSLTSAYTSASIYTNTSSTSIYTLAELINSDYASLSALTNPVSGGTLTINSVALGNWEYVVKQGNTTINSFIPAEWFSYVQDSVSSWIVVRGNLTIQNFQVLTPPVRKLFTVVYVSGNLTLTNGAITMDAKGACHQGFGFNCGGRTAAGAIRIITGTYTGVTNPEVPAVGGAGGTTASYAGGIGTAGGTGGGGNGGTNTTNPTTIGGRGSAGTSFCGGSGGGGATVATTGINGGDATNLGIGGLSGHSTFQSSGGIGPSYQNTFNFGQPTGTGSGGVLFVICKGNVTSSGSASRISANGVASAYAGSNTGPCGGASGGGSVTLLFGGTNNVTPIASGGAAQTNYATANFGGAGGAGTARAMSLV